MSQRSPLATWLAVLGGLAIALGVTGLWAQRTLGDPDTIAALAGDILEEPEIRTELALVIVDPVLDRAPREIQEQREFIVTTTAQVLGDERFVTIFQGVLRRAATRLLEGEGAVRLELDPTVELVVTEVEQVSPDVAAELAEIDPPEPVIVSAARADALRGFIAIEQAVSVILLIGGVLLGVVAVIRGGARALLPFGATLAGAAIVLFGVLLFGRFLFLAGIEPAERAEAAAAAWNIVVADLRTALLLSAGAGGLILVVGAVLGSRARTL
jgi:hypothetical protein